jgi:fatty-acyl-CoA synthase
LLIIVVDEQQQPTQRDVLDYLRPRLANWWLPDDVVVIDALPMTATGKVSKLALREQFRDYLVDVTSGRAAR